jgi:hypothetical protein
MPEAITEARAHALPPQGYAFLRHFDRHSLQITPETLFLIPEAMAETINEARTNLGHDWLCPVRWEQACLHLDQSPVEVHGSATTPVNSASASPAVQPPPPPLATPDPEPPVDLEATRKPRPRVRHGRMVQVVDTDQFAKRRLATDLKVKLSAEEKRTEKKLFAELETRGRERLVRMPRGWRARFDMLLQGMPHMAEPIDRIRECCALAEMSRKPLRIPAMLLLGPPGVGKTHFARSVADTLGVPFFPYHLESAESVSVLAGSERYWYNSQPGELFKKIVQGEFANPVILLDELARAPKHAGYQPANALHAVLERETSRGLRDKCMEIEFDASYTIYIATTNTLAGVDASLKPRFELFYIDVPGPEEALAMAKLVMHHVISELRLTRRVEAPSDEVLNQLAMFGSPRRMHQVLSRALGRAALAGRRQLLLADLAERESPKSKKRSKSDEAVH